MFSPSGPVTLTTTASSSDEPPDQSLIRYGGWWEMTVSVLLRDVSLFQFPEETCVDDNDRELLAPCWLLINKLLPILQLYCSIAAPALSSGLLTD